MPVNCSSLCEIPYRLAIVKWSATRMFSLKFAGIVMPIDGSCVSFIGVFICTFSYVGKVGYCT